VSKWCVVLAPGRTRVSVVISQGTSTATVSNVTKGWTHTKSGSAGDLDSCCVVQVQPSEITNGNSFTNTWIHS
jgi:hypothetical protein